jgi:hypothetical protein
MAGDADPTGATGDADPQKGADDGKLSMTKAELDAKMAEVRRGVETSVSKKYADYDELKTKAAEYQKLEDAKKSEAQKLAELIAAAEKRAADAEKAVGEAQIDALRAQVAAKRNLSDTQAKRLQGTTVEELEADATELFGEPKDQEPPKPTTRKPTPTLRGGLEPDEEGTPNISEIVSKIPRF